MKIAIISGYFHEGRGYQENILAEELSLIGHEVRVFAGDLVGPGISHDLSAGRAGGYEVNRVRTRRCPAGIILSWGLRQILREFRPAWVFWIGVGQFFGRVMLSDRKLQTIPVVSFFGENLGMHEFDWHKPGIGLHQRWKAFGFQVLRGSFYRRVFERSSIIVSTKRQTADILLGICTDKGRERLKEKLVDLPLGFCPRTFYPSYETRRRVRAELGIGNEEILAIVSSRFSYKKKSDILIDGLAAASETDSRLRVALVGFDDGSTVSKTIGRRIDKLTSRQRFIKQPFGPRKRLAELFNASDIGVYNNPSISVQEALGTGLYLCLSNDGSMSHLFSGSDYGLWFDRNDPSDISSNVLKAANIVASHLGSGYARWRQSIALAHRWLGYDKIVDSLLARVQIV
jgi:glycosyltransferase involved in cell wall biosynthesis